METVALKACNKCGVEKPRESFYPRGDGTARIQAKCKVCCAAAANYQKDWRRRNPEKAQNHELKRRHGITLDDYKVLFEEQQGVCAVCKKLPVGTGANSKGTLAVDHCHETGTIRGLLCTNCNLGIGSFFEQPELLKAAAAYLQQHRELVTRLIAKKFRHEKETDSLLNELIALE